MVTTTLTQYCADCAKVGLSPYGNLQANSQILYGAYHAKWIRDGIGVMSVLQLELEPRSEDLRR